MKIFYLIDIIEVSEFSMEEVVLMGKTFPPPKA